MRQKAAFQLEWESTANSLLWASAGGYPRKAHSRGGHSTRELSEREQTPEGTEKELMGQWIRPLPSLDPKLELF